MVSTTLIVVITLVSMMIYPFGMTAIFGLAFIVMIVDRRRRLGDLRRLASRGEDAPARETLSRADRRWNLSG